MIKQLLVFVCFCNVSMAFEPNSFKLDVTEDKLTELHNAKAEWHEYNVAAHALSVFEKRLARAVNEDEIDNLKMQVNVLKQIVHLKHQNWKYAVGLKLSPDTIMVKVSMDLILYEELKHKYPNEIFIINDKKPIVLMNPNFYHYYMYGGWIEGHEFKVQSEFNPNFK